jgi:gliding motility-associated-like protein
VTIHSAKEFPFGLIIPQGLSPNSDGLNDVFEIIGIDKYPDNELHVFNSHGAEIYQMKSYNNTWDGTSSIIVSNGGKLATGTYFYMLDLGSNRIVKGFVYLINE